MACDDARDLAMITLGLDTGIRVGGMAGIRRQDMVHIPHEHVDDRGTSDLKSQWRPARTHFGTHSYLQSGEAGSNRAWILGCSRIALYQMSIIVTRKPAASEAVPFQFNEVWRVFHFRGN